MNVAHGNRDELYRDLIRSHKSHPKESGEFTSREFASDTGLNYSTAKYRLQKMIDTGILQKRKLNMKGARTDLYSFVKDAGKKGKVV